MEILVDINDDALLQLLLMARRHRRSLNEEILEILEPASRPEKIRMPGRQRVKAERTKSEPKGSF
jgi:plasmid stability protein